MEERDIGLLIKRLADKIKISVDVLLKEQGITFSQTLVIGFLYSQSGSATQKEIEDHLQVSHPTVVGIISRLEKNGFVSCHTDQKDRRNKIVCATDKALNTVDAMSVGKRQMEERLTKGLSEEELAEFRRIINIFCENI
ncbi:MAG: MarR family transcriptional regulator [Oscillospiraceae bacterium]|nr:MarR family transcriptional regulator [Oscillospiraceae bacterium]